MSAGGRNYHGDVAWLSHSWQVGLINFTDMGLNDRSRSLYDQYFEKDFSAFWGPERRGVSSSRLYRNRIGNLHRSDHSTAAWPQRLWEGGDYFGVSLTSQ